MAAVAAIVVVVATSCVGPPVPSQVGSVPGTYTFQQSIIGFGSNGPVYGAIDETTLICWSVPTALKITWAAGYTTVKGDFSVVGGATYTPPGAFWGTVVTDVLGPGCGNLFVITPSLFSDPTGQTTVTLEVTPA
jgi:hypothetical protein